MATKRKREVRVYEVLIDGRPDGTRKFSSAAGANRWTAERPGRQLVRRSKEEADRLSEATGKVVLPSPRTVEETVWRGRVLVDSDGRRRERIFDKQGDAKAWEKEMESAFDQGFDPELGKRLLRSWHAEWRTGRPAEAGAPSSRARDESIWRNHIEPVFGSRSLASIKRNDVKGFAVALMEEKGLALEMVRRVVGLLAMMLDGAIDHGLIRSNPARNLRLKDTGAIRVPTRKPKSWEVLSREEMFAIADAVPPKFRALVLTCCMAGLRPEEAAGLRWPNVVLDSVDLAGPRIRVEEVLSEVGKLHHRGTKTGNQRVVEITPELVAVLTAHLEAFGPGPGGLVFTSIQGAPLRRNNFGKRVLGPTAVRVIGKWISPHDLRRSCGSLLIAAGVDPVSAAAILGDTVETFLAHYAGLYEGGMRVALERFSAFLQEAESGADFDVDGAQRGHEAAG